MAEQAGLSHTWSQTPKTGFLVTRLIWTVKLWAGNWYKMKQTNEPLHDKPTKWLCAQRRLRSAWASAQSDQSLHCLLSGLLRTQCFFMRTVKTLIRICPFWLVFAGRIGHFVGFVVLRLRYVCHCTISVWNTCIIAYLFISFTFKQLFSLIYICTSANWMHIQ